MSTVKFIITNPNKLPIRFGQVWGNILKALEEMGAYSLGKYSQKVPLSNILESASCTKTEFSAVHESYITWKNIVGFENRQNVKISIFQSINTDYGFLMPEADYIVLNITNASELLTGNIATNIIKKLFNDNYRIHIPKTESTEKKYIMYTELYFKYYNKL